MNNKLRVQMPPRCAETCPIVDKPLLLRAIGGLARNCKGPGLPELIEGSAHTNVVVGFQPGSDEPAIVVSEPDSAERIFDKSQPTCTNPAADVYAKSLS